MPFMVIYRGGDGSAGYEEADVIDEAALFVERLRNNDAIDQIRLFRMEEISFAFRPYYKVELGMPDRAAPESVRPPSHGGRSQPDGPVTATNGTGTNGTGTNGTGTNAAGTNAATRNGAGTNQNRPGLFQR